MQLCSPPPTSSAAHTVALRLPNDRHHPPLEVLVGYHSKMPQQDPMEQPKIESQLTDMRAGLFGINTLAASNVNFDDSERLKQTRHPLGEGQRLH